MSAMTTLSRRSFAASLSAASLAGALHAAKPNYKIGVQLYSVRQVAAKDLPGTLAGLKKAGFEGVEFAGYYNHSAADIKKFLADNGLLCCGTHTALESVMGDKLKETVEFNKTFGNNKLIVPWIDEKFRANKQGWLDMARKFNEISDRANELGAQVGYHNHDVEFKPMEGALPWDLFFGNTKKEVIMQVDTGNCMHGGADPIPFISKYPGRAWSCHIKEYSKTKEGALIGEGDMKWPQFLAACQKVGKTQWFIVEEESGKYPGLEAVSRSITNLKRLLA